MFDEDDCFRSTVVVARHAYGEGSYRYSPTRSRRWSRPCDSSSTRRSRPLRTSGPSSSTADHLHLHQDVYGDLTFPLQFLVMLSRPDADFTGGESVFVEQRPRQQARPMVLSPKQGEAVIFPVPTRPKLGARSYHRVRMRPGVAGGDRPGRGRIARAD